MVRALLTLALCWAATLPAAAQSEQERLERSRVLFMEGIAAYEAGQLNVALRKLKAAHQNYKMPELAFNIGRVYERMSNADEAKRWFRIYLRRGNPAAETRADVERRIAELDQMDRRQRDQIFTAPPSEDEVTAEAARFFQRGVAMFQREEYPAALQAFSAVHNLTPQLVEVYYNLAVTCERLEKYDDAMDYYRTYVIERRAILGRWPPDRNLIRAKIRALEQAKRRRLARQ